MFGAAFYAVKQRIAQKRKVELYEHRACTWRMLCCWPPFTLAQAMHRGGRADEGDEDAPSWVVE